MPSASADSCPMNGPRPPVRVDERSLGRLRWRCRRGRLENDLILARFLDASGATMTSEDVAALDRLLDLADNELWDLLAGRAEPDDAAVRPLLAALRNVSGCRPETKEP
jgi:antitoxin CptB